MSDKMSASTNALNWFEISVTDMNRAQKFYETIFEISMIPVEMMGMSMCMFNDGSSGSVGGSLVKSENHKPNMDGAVIYLNANPDLQLVLNRVEKAGGKILMPKMLIDENTGNMAFIADTEGNKVGLHSNK